MLKKVLLLICLSVFAFNATKAQTDNEARKVLDKTAAIVGNKGGALANFKLTSGKIGTINGTISIKGNMRARRRPRCGSMAKRNGAIYLLPTR